MIQIQTKEWRDKQNGNSYFSAEVHLGMDLILVLPFQYGYNGARDTVERILAKHFNVSAERWELRDMLRQNGIEISESKSDSLKRNLAKESFEDFTPFYKVENLALYAAHRMREGIAINEMGNLFIDWLNNDSVGVTYADGSNKLLPINLLNWF
jgi:hypothetical protein